MGRVANRSGVGFKGSVDKESLGRRGEGRVSQGPGAVSSGTVLEAEWWVRVPGSKPRVQTRTGALSQGFSLKDTRSVP